jgi:hypothetical protein
MSTHGMLSGDLSVVTHVRRFKFSTSFVLESQNKRPRNWRGRIKKPLVFSGLFFILERIANGNAVTVHTRSAELKVIAHKIEVPFRANKDVVGHVKTNTAANMRHEMVAAGEVGAAGE